MIRPQVSVVVCHHKGDFIYKFVESLRKSICADYELIVVSSDTTIDRVKLGKCTLITTILQFPAAKRNLGVSFTKYDYVAFFDDDVEIEQDCLSELYHSIYDRKAGMVYGKLYKADEKERLDEAGGYLTWSGFIWSRAEQNKRDDGGYGVSCKIFSGKSASCIIEKRAFYEVGKFDESFGILGEESDLSWRLWLAGRTIYFEPRATGIHYFNTVFKRPEKYYTSERVNYNGCRNYITMLLKNLGGEHLWMAFINMMIWIIVGLAMIGTLKVKQGVNIFRGIFYVMRNWKDIMLKRKSIQDSRVRSDKELWPDIYRKVRLSYYMQRFFRYIGIGLHG